jgi:hypothetical protein
MDNQVFNINGTDKKLLKKVLKLAFMLNPYRKAEAWKIDKEKGLVLFWSKEKDTTAFVEPLDAKGVFGFVWDFLNSEEALKIDLKDWDRNLEDDGFDGSTDRGWRVYTERWGRIGKGNSEYDSYNYSFLAITPCYAWYGK